MSQTFGADSMPVFTVVAHQIQKGQVCFVSLFWMCECVICTSYIVLLIKVTVDMFLKCLQERKENILFSSAFISCWDFCVLLWFWCMIMEQIKPSFPSSFWKMHVWFTGTSDGMKKHFKSQNMHFYHRNVMINKS